MQQFEPHQQLSEQQSQWQSQLNIIIKIDRRQNVVIVVGKDKWCRLYMWCSVQMNWWRVTKFVAHTIIIFVPPSYGGRLLIDYNNNNNKTSRIIAIDIDVFC